MVPLTNQLANYEICYGNRFHADTEGFNIESSAFQIEGVEGDVYLTDILMEVQQYGNSEVLHICWKCSQIH